MKLLFLFFDKLCYTICGDTMSGIIFNIQKFSIHDGPGIRTTIFFKGCPLRCVWCANPESQNINIEVVWDQRKCIHCLECIKHSNNQITHSNKRIIIENTTNQNAINCATICPTNALTIEGEYKEIEEVVAIVLQDKAFYEESGGGVTLSGGEALIQLPYVEVLTKQLKHHNIHIAVETTGYIAHATFKKIAPLFDLLLFDVKHYDTDKHYQGTLVHNERIIKNLRWAIENKLNVLPRIPVIPRFNHTLADAQGIAQLLKNIGATKAQLLPFHQFGEAKYQMLNKKYLYENEQALYPEDLKDYQKIFIMNDIDCFF